MQPVAALGVLRHDLDGAVPLLADLAYQHAVVVFVEQRPHPVEKGDVLGPVLREAVILHVVGVHRRARIVALLRRVRPQLRVVEIVVHRVEPEAVHPALEPEAHGLEQRILHRRIVEVEIGLLDQEVVQVILPPHPVPFPRRAAEDRGPVVGRRAVRVGIGPDIPVRPRIAPACAALDEPRMLLRGVAQHLVDDDLEPLPVRLCHQRVEIPERAEERLDIGVVRHVVAHVGHGRGKDRREPDRIGPELRDMPEPAGDAGQIAHPVAGAVLKRAGIDLIDHAAAPPFAHEEILRLVCWRGPAPPMTSGLPRQCAKRVKAAFAAARGAVKAAALPEAHEINFASNCN